jgi:hypothetical protein
MSGFVIKPAARRRTEPVAALPEHTDPPRHRILSNYVKDCDEAREFVAEIEKLWSEAQEKFLIIGRYLVQAKARLKHGEFEAMVATQLPFGKNVAYQLRAVAQAVEHDRLEERNLPRSYSNAFRLAQMDEAILQRAREKNLVRPDVTRREIIDFLSAIAAETEQRRPERERVAQEIEKLRIRVASLEDELAETRAKLAELKASTAGEVPDDCASASRTVIGGRAEEVAA